MHPQYKRASAFAEALFAFCHHPFNLGKHQKYFHTYLFLARKYPHLFFSGYLHPKAQTTRIRQAAYPKAEGLQQRGNPSRDSLSPPCEGLPGAQNTSACRIYWAITCGISGCASYKRSENVATIFRSRKVFSTLIASERLTRYSNAFSPTATRKT